MKAFSYPYSLRLHLKRDFQRVFEQGRKTVQPEVIFWHRERGDPGPARLSVIVSGKLAEAVGRNRIKRLIRESFRRARPRFKPGFDIVVYPRPGRCRWSGYEQARRSLESSWQKAGFWL